MWGHEDTETRRHGDMDMKMEARKHGDKNMATLRHGHIKRKTGASEIFLEPFTVCSLCKWKFVIYFFMLVDVEANISYPFANRLNRINRLNRPSMPLTQKWRPRAIYKNGDKLKALSSEF